MSVSVSARVSRFVSRVISDVKSFGNFLNVRRYIRAAAAAGTEGPSSMTAANVSKYSSQILAPSPARAFVESTAMRTEGKASASKARTAKRFRSPSAATLRTSAAASARTSALPGARSMRTPHAAAPSTAERSSSSSSRASPAFLCVRVVTSSTKCSSAFLD